MNVKINEGANTGSHMRVSLIMWRNLKDEKQGGFQHKILKEEFGQPQKSANDM